MAEREAKAREAAKPESDFAESVHDVLVLFARDGALSGPPATEPCPPLPEGTETESTWLYIEWADLAGHGVTAEEGAPQVETLETITWKGWTSECFPEVKPPGEVAAWWRFSTGKGQKWSAARYRYVVGSSAYDRRMVESDVGDRLIPGVYEGGVFVYDLQARQKICQAPFSAASSQVVEWRSGGAFGKSEKEALRGNFKANAWKAREKALKAIGSPAFPYGCA